MTPLRIQRRRTKGFKLPANTVCVTRSIRDGYDFSNWGNPFKGATAAADFAEVFKEGYIPMSVRKSGHTRKFDPSIIRAELRGKNLACYCRLCPAHADGKPFDVDCPDCAPCHGDVLGRLANRFP